MEGILCHDVEKDKTKDCPRYDDSPGGHFEPGTSFNLF
jgi:hypothetical protein